MINIPHNRLTFDAKETNAVLDVIESGHWACGEKVDQLETVLTQIFNRKYAVCVSTGFSALRLALLSLGIKSGDEVIIPAYCCVALVNAILASGGTPIPVDIMEGSWNINPYLVDKAINKKTRAIIAVHTFGYPAMIYDLCQMNIPVIEDCAHGFGIQINNKMLGSSASPCHYLLFLCNKIYWRW